MEERTLCQYGKISSSLSHSSRQSPSRDVSWVLPQGYSHPLNLEFYFKRSCRFSFYFEIYLVFMWNELSWNLTEKCLPQIYSLFILLLLVSCILWDFCALSWETQAVEHGNMKVIPWYESIWNYSFSIKHIEKILLLKLFWCDRATEGIFFSALYYLYYKKCYNH